MPSKTLMLLCNYILSLLYLNQKKNKAIYRVHDKNNNLSAKFNVRKNTSDKFVIMETWKYNTYYNKKDFYNKRNLNIVDIGANIGAFTVYASMRAPDGKVFAFEPLSENFSVLNENVELNKSDNIKTFKLGILDKNIRIPIYLSEKNMNKGIGSVHKTNENIKEYIKCRSLKDIFEICGIKKIDLLKIDAEGSEYPILLNSDSKTLKKIDKIVLEFHDSLDNRYNYKDLKAHLIQQGFKVRIKAGLFSSIIYLLFKIGTLYAIRK